jgi:hypothetical protein
MIARHADAQYEIDDDWWREAGMAGFKPARRTFRPGASQRARVCVIEVPVAEVEPVSRRLSHGVFNDSEESGSARDRVVRILQGFRLDSPIPPVEVVRTPEGPFRYRLHAGAHRFCCAVVAGFEAVPAVDVTEPEVTHVDLDA